MVHLQRAPLQSGHCQVGLVLFLSKPLNLIYKSSVNKTFFFKYYLVLTDESRRKKLDRNFSDGTIERLGNCHGTLRLYLKNLAGNICHSTSVSLPVH